MLALPSKVHAGGFGRSIERRMGCFVTDYITTQEAAQIIGCGQRHVNKLFHAGLLAGQMFGRVIQIERASAQAYAPARSGPRDGFAIEQMQPYNRWQ